jgi:hypothetical protein
MRHSIDTGKNRALLVFAALAVLAASSLDVSAAGIRFPIATTAGREMTASLAFDGTNFLVAIQGNSTDDDHVGAQLVSPNGIRVGSLITTGHLGGAPVVAFDGTNYLIIWQDCGVPCSSDLYGTFINTAGTAVGSPFLINPSIYDVAGLAFGGGAYLAVYYLEEVMLVPSEVRTVRGRLIAPNGTVGAELPISSGYGDHGKNSVAFDGTNFLVVWVDDLSVGTIKGRLVSTTGTLGTETTINTSSNRSDDVVSVAFDGTNYLVVWANQAGGPGGEWDLFGQLVDKNGSNVGGVIDVSTAPGTQVFPCVAFGGNEYLITWTDARNDANDDFACDGGEGSCIDIRGRAFARSGLPAGPEIKINAQAGNQFGSPVAFGGSRFLVAWTDGDWIDGLVGNVFGAWVPPQLLFFRAD